MLGSSGVPEIIENRRENDLGTCNSVAKRERNEEEEAAVAVAEAERLSAANRWPEEETLALLRIRSDMDVAFRDAGSKAPLSVDVSRKMAELGYNRSAKKCKEKFENIYKYHKRLKSCSYARPNGKTYRFFDQLEALDHHQISFSPSIPKQLDGTMNDSILTTTPSLSNAQSVPLIAEPISVHFDSSPITTSTSGSSSSGSESEGEQKKKKKWAEFFDKLMKSVLEKQEDLQKKFLEAIDKCEWDRLAREEAWKMQEIARIKREHELLVQERSISAAKDAAVLAFLQKISEQGKFSNAQMQIVENTGLEMSTPCGNEKDTSENASSRWPKEEVETLIRVRSNMDLEYQRIGPKGTLWEDVSMAMKKLGYDRSSKRCKEKWENINKYYRRVKESNKQRPIDSKTCPYFHLLDSLYSAKTKRFDNSEDSPACNLKPEELLMHMMNHQTGQQHEQVMLPQEQGESVMDHGPTQNGNGTQDEDELVEYEERNQQTVSNDPPMNAVA